MPVYKDKDKGTWFVVRRYTNHKGERKMTTKRGFKTMREAKMYENSFLLKEDNSLDLYFEEFVDIYLAAMDQRLRLNTMMTKRAIFENKITPFFEGKRLCDITALDVTNWHNQLLKPKQDGGMGLSKLYLKTIHNQLSALFNYAVRIYDLKSNPARKVGNIGSRQRRELEFWTKEEYLKFSKSMMKVDGIYQAFEILYWCGLRLGELLALTKADFDFDKKTLRINKSYQKIKKQDIITDPKTEKGKRTIQVPEFLCEEMKDYISRQYDLKDNDRLFPFAKSKLHHEMTRGCNETGVKRIRIHDLRHSHVSLLIDMGFSAVDIAERVGHESINITYTYAHMFPSKDKEIANKLDNFRKE